MSLYPVSMTTGNRFLGVRTRHAVARELGISLEKLAFLLYRLPADKRYKRFEIPKKNGGVREIFAPVSAVKQVQRNLAGILSELYKPPKNVWGFIDEGGVLKNATPHKGRRYVFNLDLKDFFPSFNFGRVRGLFLSRPFFFPKDVATLIAQICCINGCLPQGAPTSPIISNMICRKLDNELRRLAKCQYCLVTRYADDITFSKKKGEFPYSIGFVDGKGVAHVGDELKKTIEENGFRIHPDKIRLQANHDQQKVTGLVVNSSKVNVDRRFVRQIRAMIHAWKKHGLPAAELEYHTLYYSSKGAQRCLPPFDFVVRGKLEFVRMVKGVDDPVYKNIQGQLAQIDPETLKLMKKQNAKKSHRDFFISHASEDKDDVARPLYEGLIKAGASVWLDENEIQVGDSLREKIDEGLANSRFGIVLLSNHFFGKHFPTRELNGLAAREVQGKKVILPVWHNISYDEVVKNSPPLADAFALKWTDGVDHVVQALLRVLNS